MARIYDKFPILNGKDPDERSRRYLTPPRIVWSTLDEGAEITGMENVSQYKTFLNAVMDLQGNKLDAVIIDKPVGQAILASLNDPSLVMVDMGLQADWYGIEVNKNNPELLAKIDAALDALEAEGFFEKLAVKYFSSSEEAAE